MSYIIIFRRSPTARYLDVQLGDDGKIAVFGDDPDGTPLIAAESDLIAYVGSNETEPRAVDAELAHKVLGWEIPA